MTMPHMKSNSQQRMAAHKEAAKGRIGMYLVRIRALNCMLMMQPHANELSSWQRIELTQQPDALIPNPSTCLAGGVGCGAGGR
jgi:hypothetical protein